MWSWFAQLTPGDWTLLVGLLANAAVMFYGLRHLDRKVDRARADAADRTARERRLMIHGIRQIDRKVETVRGDLEVVRAEVIATNNGLEAALVATATSAGEAKGRADEKIDEAERQRKTQPTSDQ